jgi:hypothetical protein
MKNKILIITAILAVIAMIGIAMASNIEVLGDGITINRNLDGDHLVTINTNGYEANHLNITGPLDKFTVKVDNVEKYPVLINGVLTITVPSAISGSTYKFTFVNNKGAPNGEYIYNYDLMWSTGSSTRTAYIQAGVNAIPEIPAVALPIAAVIGLVFFLQQRKEKEE